MSHKEASERHKSYPPLQSWWKNIEQNPDTQGIVQVPKVFVQQY